MKSFNLAGKDALVTRGNGIVGLGMARDADKASAALATFHDTGVRALFKPVDIDFIAGVAATVDGGAIAM